MTLSDSPSSPRPPETNLKDRLAAVARQGPPKSRAKMWIWIVFGGAALIAGLLQVFGITSSPVAEKVLQERRARERNAAPKPSAPDAPAPQTPPR